MTVMTTTSDVQTKALFVKTLREKLGHFDCCSPDDWTDVSNIAGAITANHLSLAIMPGVRPAITFEAYFQALFGQKLDGSPVRRKRA
jgi:hypothetical protein